MNTFKTDHKIFKVKFLFEGKDQFVVLEEEMKEVIGLMESLGMEVGDKHIN